MREDLNELLDALLPSAQHFLNKSGEFFPFGAIITAEGEVVATAAYTGTERPPSKDVMAVLQEGFRSRARDGTIRACGMCYNAGTSAPNGTMQDAIILDLESRDECARVAIPYTKKFLLGYQLGELIRVAMDPVVFVGERTS